MSGQMRAPDDERCPSMVKDRRCTRYPGHSGNCVHHPEDILRPDPGEELA